MADESRRKFLKVATVAIGGIIGAVAAFPLVRYFLFPAGRKVVLTADEPIDVIALDALEVGAPPRKVIVYADGVRDAWTVDDRVPLGAAWLRRIDESGTIVAFTSSCPHLGCAVDLGADGDYHCPCHKSSFGVDGARKSGPAKRGLDELETKTVNGRVLVRFARFRTDIAERRKV